MGMAEIITDSLGINQNIKNIYQEIDREKHGEFNDKLDDLKILLKTYFPKIDLSLIKFEKNKYDSIKFEKDKYDSPYCIINGCEFSTCRYLDMHWDYYQSKGLFIRFKTKFLFFTIIKTRNFLGHTLHGTPAGYGANRNDTLIDELIEIDKIFKNPKRIDMEYNLTIQK